MKHLFFQTQVFSKSFLFYILTVLLKEQSLLHKILPQTYLFFWRKGTKSRQDLGQQDGKLIIVIIKLYLKFAMKSYLKFAINLDTVTKGNLTLL